MPVAFVAFVPFLQLATSKSYAFYATGDRQCMCPMLQLLSSKPTWYISSGASADDKQRIAIVKKDLFNNSHSASVFLNANTSQHFAQPVPDYSARGDFTNRSFFVYRGAAPVAEVGMHA